LRLKNTTSHNELAGNLAPSDATSRKHVTLVCPQEQDDHTRYQNDKDPIQFRETYFPPSRTSTNALISKLESVERKREIIEEKSNCPNYRIPNYIQQPANKW
jgi:hypothetical protein